MKWKKCSPKAVKRLLFRALQAYIVSEPGESHSVRKLSKRFNLPEKEVRFFLNVEGLKLENGTARGPQLYRKFVSNGRGAPRLEEVQFINGPDDAPLATESYQRVLHRGKKWQERQTSMEEHLPKITGQPLIQQISVKEIEGGNYAGNSSDSK